MREIPYVVLEGITARMERTIKKLWILCIILIVLLVGSNIVWIVYENQFETVTTTNEVTQETDGGGNNYAIGGDYNGETND